MVEGVQVLDFGLGAVIVCADRSHGQVGINPHGTFFHFHIRSAGELHDLAQLFQVLIGFFRTGDIRLGHDFNQWGPLTVQIDIRIAIWFMLVFPSIFFDVQFGDADFLLFAVDFDFHPAVSGQWLFRLGHLVGFGVIWVEVVLPIKMGIARDISVQR